MRKCELLLSKLTDEDKQSFHRWLIAELDGRQGSILLLLEGYLQGRQEEVLWQYIFPGTPFDSQELGRRFGQLMILIEEFLAIQGFRKDRMLRDRLLLKRLNELRLGKEFVKYLNKVRRRLDRQTRRDHRYYEHLFAIEGEHIQYQIVEKVKKANRRYQHRREALLHWFSHTYMNQQVMQLARKEQVLQNLSVDWEENLMNLIRLYASSHEDSVLNLTLEFADVLAGNKNECEALMRQLRACQHQLSRDLLYNLFGALYNHLARLQQKTKDEQYFFLRLELEQIGIEDGWMIFNGYLSGRSYKNHISLRNTCMYLLPLGEREKWMEDTLAFLETYQSFLQPFEREEVYEFNYLQCQFFHGQPDALLGRRKFVPFSDPHDESDFRIFQLLARFVQKDVFLIESMIKSSQQYIRSQAKLSKLRKKKALDELKLIKKLFKASSKQDWKDIDVETTLRSKNAKYLWLAEYIQQNA